MLPDLPGHLSRRPRQGDGDIGVRAQVPHDLRRPRIQRKGRDGVPAVPASGERAPPTPTPVAWIEKYNKF